MEARGCGGLRDSGSNHLSRDGQTVEGIADALRAELGYLMPVYSDNSFSIGRTPLVRLNRVTAGLPVTILAKVEGRNPAYSVKCRIGASMIWDAEKRGVLT